MSRKTKESADGKRVRKEGINHEELVQNCLRATHTRALHKETRRKALNRG